MSLLQQAKHDPFHVFWECTELCEKMIHLSTSDVKLLACICDAFEALKAAIERYNRNPREH